MRCFSGFLSLLLCVSALSFSAAYAQAGVTEICPGTGIQPRPAQFQPGGLILTAFDSAALWVYDIDRLMRYPLPDTVPCTTNCRLSYDATWVTYLDPKTYIYMKMRLDGTERTPITADAADVMWWNATTLLIWTPDHRAYLQAEGADPEQREYLQAEGAISIQPGGRWGVILEVRGDGTFMRVLVNLETRPQPGMTPAADEQKTYLAPDIPYFNQTVWTSDGHYLAYVGRGAFNEAAQIAGAELFLIQPGSAIPEQTSFFSSWYGAVRIGGIAPGSLYPSPDGTKLAFWVIPLTGADPTTNTGEASLHLLDVNTRQIVRYCGYQTGEHTPNPPRLAWSADSTHLAFAGNVEGDDKGALLLTLNISDGTLTELSDGIAPALGKPDVLVWGNRP